MRVIVYGVGAIGGSIAARLVHAGHEVVGIARGEQLKAINEKGLTLQTPLERITAKFPCVGSPADINFQPDDVIILAMKTQHTIGALSDLRAAGAYEQAIFCAQNGVENERIALRMFPHVYAMLVALPADFITPGEVVAFGAPKIGIFDIGCYPSGTDEVVDAVVAKFNDSGLAAFSRENVMGSKYGKLLVNLSNVIDAAMAVRGKYDDLIDRATVEAKAAMAAAGVEVTNVGMSDPRRKDHMVAQDIPGFTRTGTSSAQSLARGAPSIETDYLNGEVSLLGRLHNVPTPVNDYFCRLGHALISEKIGHGEYPKDRFASETANL